MKKSLNIFLTIAVCFLSLSNAYAQRYYDDRGSRSSRPDLTGTVASYLDLHVGEGIGRGSKGTGGANVSFLYRFAPEFQFGVGSGLDYIHALARQGKVDNKKDFDYHGELTVPVFLRGRYLLGDVYSRSASFFAQVDLGYRFGISAYNTGKYEKITKNFEKCNVKGFFFEPQIGIAPNETISFSLGFPFQHYTKHISDVSASNTEVTEDFKTKSLMFMALNFHVMIGF